MSGFEDFCSAVSDLLTSRIQLFNGEIQTEPSIYATMDQARNSLTSALGSTGEGGSPNGPGSKPPVSIAAIEWRTDLDKAVQSWARQRASQAALRGLAEDEQQATESEWQERANILRKLVDRGEVFLGKVQPLRPLRDQTCPRCSTSTVTHKRSGETVSLDVLVYDPNTTMVTCRACSSVYPPALFAAIAKFNRELLQ